VPQVPLRRRLLRSGRGRWGGGVGWDGGAFDHDGCEGRRVRGFCVGVVLRTFQTALEVSLKGHDPSPQAFCCGLQLQNDGISRRDKPAVRASGCAGGVGGDLQQLDLRAGADLLI
jgi:hypothetical protein